MYDSRLLFNSQQYPQTRSGWEDSDVLPTTRVLPRERYLLALFPIVSTHTVPPPSVHTRSIHAANWECHSEVADMIQLQQMGLHGPLGEEGKMEEEEGTPAGSEKEEQHMLV